MMKRITNSAIAFYSMLLLAAHAALAADDCLVDITLTPREILQGTVALLRLRASQRVHAAHYLQDNRRVLFYYDNATGEYRAFLGVDLEERPGTRSIPVTLTRANARAITKTIDFTILKNEFPAEHLSVSESQVTLSAQDNKRYEREKKAVDAVLQKPTGRKLRDCGFIKPLPREVATPFGVRRFFNNKPRNPHSGVDFTAPEGTPVVASHDGRVVLTGNHFFSGNAVYIDHGSGIITMYFHLASYDVASGDPVTKGQIIGNVGATGRATGPHLHWGLRINNRRIDPLSLLGSCGNGASMNSKGAD